MVESLFGLSQKGVDFVTGSDVTRRLGQPDCSGKDFGSFGGAVRIEQRPTQVAVSRGVSRIELDGASKRLDGFCGSPHFHQAASQSHPARLVLWVELEKLAESSHLAFEDFWVVVGQLEKVTEVASARLAVRRIARLAGESFGFALRRRGLLGPVWLANPSDSLCGDEACSVPSRGVIFEFAVWACLAIRSKEIRILSDLRNKPQRRGTALPAPPIFFRGLRDA